MTIILYDSYIAVDRPFADIAFAGDMIAVIRFPIGL